MPADGVVKIGTDTWSVQTCTRCESLITTRMATLQGIRVSRNSIVKRELVRYFAIVSITVTPRSIAILASFTQEMGVPPY